MLKIDKVKLTKEETLAFPDSFDLANRIFIRYFDIGFVYNEGMLSPLGILNKAQKALCYYWITTGHINNGGFWATLLEGLGNYDEGFIDSLKMMNNQHDLEIYKQVVVIFHDHKDYFMRMEVPPVFDDESEEYRPDLWEHLEQLEKAWYAGEPKREALCKKFLKNHLHDLVEVV